MQPNPELSPEGLSRIISSYEVGSLGDSKGLLGGSGGRALLVRTERGAYVLKHYPNREEKHVLFEARLLSDLGERGFPAPSIIRNRAGDLMGIDAGRPHLLMEFIEGQHGDNPNEAFNPIQVAAVVRTVARLHVLTADWRADDSAARTPFDGAYCWKTFARKHPGLLEEERGRWFKARLDERAFPANLPMAICHADLNVGNFIFRNGEVAAMLDFDMSFHGPMVYDLASLIYWWTWPPKRRLDAGAATLIAREYSKCREMSQRERAAVYDYLMLIRLLGIAWSDEGGYQQERENIEWLRTLGRDGFMAAIFSG